MSTLTKERIIEYMNREEIEDRLIVTPLLDPFESFDPASINVRLGNEFIVMRKQFFPILDISDEDQLSERIEKYQEKVRIDYKEEFVLHPNQLIIGSTFEYVSLPDSLMCYVIGKSNWGRMGLIIATATKVDPGFKGAITLEIINEGEVPVVLYPGIPIAQLVFHETTGKAKYSGTYNYATGPQFPDFNKKYEKWKFWYPQKE
ncbi:MAG: dCTP deaminase [Syntrophomonadaceae bacterium]|nr:dCTP deaminase [Bacillota bacterium]